MYYFCTYFDQNYLPRGLSLYRSLREHSPKFKLWVLCMDESTHKALTDLDLPEIVPVALEDFEKGDEPLLRAKQNRLRVEYYFTCTPSFPLYILNHWPEIDLITYIDADLFFFASPALLFEELGSGSIAIISHRFPPHLKYREKWGKYNVGFLSFRRDDNGFECLNWWRERCNEWCYDREEEGKFADQKYLDDWITRFKGVVVIEHEGANVAFWNLYNQNIIERCGKLTINDSDLIFFHFHNVKQINKYIYDFNFSSYFFKPSRIILSKIIQPYIRVLKQITSSLPYRFDNMAVLLNIRTITSQNKSLSVIRRSYRLLRNIIKRNYVFYINGYVI